MPTATIHKHPWTTNDLVPQCVLTREVAKCFQLKVGRATVTLTSVTQTHPWTTQWRSIATRTVYIDNMST